jgi:predicted nucleic acid-binding protein
VRFVLDASTVITWAMRDEDHPIADLAFERIRTDSSAVVPSIWWYEIRNILLLNERRNRISSKDSHQFLSDLSGFEIELRPVENSQSTIDLARQQKLSVYDAAYLALAMNLKLPIATLDEALQSAARSVNVPLLS